MSRFGMPSMWEAEMESKEPVQEERHSHQDSSRLSGGDGIKKTISTILAIAGAIGFLFLIGGGVRMSMLASQSGNSVAEYYYRTMGICMIGFSFVAAGLLWGLSWMVAAWPDNQEIIAALTDKTPDSRTRAPAGCATVETNLSSREEKTPTGGTGEQSS